LPTPSFSIVIETENLGRTNWRSLWNCLEALDRQALLHEAREVVFADGRRVSTKVKEALG
jgi:hypothetical protein